MTRQNLKELKKFEDYLTTGKPEDKIAFLESNILKISKNSKKHLTKKHKQHRCPVYKCFKQCTNEFELKHHFEREHKDLINLGLDLHSNNSNQFAGFGGQVVRGKINSALINQILMFALTHKDAVGKIMKGLQDEVEKEKADGEERDRRRRTVGLEKGPSVQSNGQ